MRRQEIFPEEVTNSHFGVSTFASENTRLTVPAIPNYN